MTRALLSVWRTLSTHVSGDNYLCLLVDELTRAKFLNISVGLISDVPSQPSIPRKRPALTFTVLRGVGLLLIPLAWLSYRVGTTCQCVNTTSQPPNSLLDEISYCLYCVGKITGYRMSVVSNTQPDCSCSLYDDDRGSLACDFLRTEGNGSRVYYTDGLNDSSTHTLPTQLDSIPAILSAARFCRQITRPQFRVA